MFMASTSHNPTPSSSVTTSHPTKWDVFISFRGIDTRDSFTDFLYQSLHRTGIRTFRDDPELRRGEVISDALLQAIHESKTYVVVFSKNYASSPWCLDELVEILDCHRSMSRLVLPVFYYIEPSVIKYQTGSFKKAFLTHESHDTRYEKGRLDRWRDTLNQVGKFSGYHVRKNMSQADVINEIVDRALQEVNPMTLDVAKYQVGLESRIEHITTLLSNVTAGVTRIGIYGMGGVGKTTLAKAVYNQNYLRFQGSCFLENVSEASQTRKGIVCLQQKLVNDVLKCKNITIDNADHGIELIRARICTIKILVVIDDLDNEMPLDFLEGPFALGSAIIITTRYEDLLDSVEVEAKYKVNELGDVESRKLFCQHAFGGDSRMSDTFTELSKEILKRAGGLPLALKICGSALHKESEEGLRCIIDQMKRVSIVDVDKILMISFDALKLVDPMLQDIFLDIACFFIGQAVEDVVKILETCYTSVNYSIGILKKRCLLTINHRRFVMHDLVLDMGRRIASNNSHNVEKRSRLWVSEDIHELLEENKGTEAIEGIIPSDFELYSENFSEQDSFTAAMERKYFAADTFRKMCKLRFLYLENVYITGSFEHAFNDLRWLYWDRCPLRFLPSEFHMKKLVCLALPGSNLRTMWELNMVPQVFQKLKTLDMSYSKDLTTTTDFTKLPCLEIINLEGCSSLEEVHISIGSLVRLASLNLWGCENLKCLPDSICNLRALKSLNIGSCSNLKAIPMNLGNIESLAELNARLLSICKLPHSIGCLSKLVELDLSCCENLKTLPGTICNLRSLKVLHINLCSNLEELPKQLGDLVSLVELEAAGLAVSKLPDSIGRLSMLVKLDLSSSKKLKTLPDTICNLRSLKVLDISRCGTLEVLPIGLGNLESLVQLEATKLAVSEIPESIGRIGSLESIRLRSCLKLLSIAELPSSLKLISLEGCTAIERLPNLSNMKHLKELDLTDCSGLTEIQGLEKLTSILALYLRGCNASLLNSAFTKRFFQTYSGLGHHIKIYASSSVFPDWICQSADWISKTSNIGSTVSLDLPPHVSHNFLAMILCSKHSPNHPYGTAVYSVDTTTNGFVFRSSDYYDCMNIIPRTIFSVTDDDHRIEFTTYLEFLGTLTKAEIIGIHLLYKPEITIIEECDHQCR